MNPRSKSLLAAALAGALSLPAALQAQDSKPSGDDSSLKPCWGINTCKGAGDCGADGCRQSGCHGSNACKGRGFLRLQPETCLKIQGGRLTKAAASSKKGQAQKKSS